MGSSTRCQCHTVQAPPPATDQQPGNECQKEKQKQQNKNKNHCCPQTYSIRYLPLCSLLLFSPDAPSPSADLWEPALQHSADAQVGPCFDKYRGELEAKSYSHSCKAYWSGVMDLIISPLQSSSHLLSDVSSSCSIPVMQNSNLTCCFWCI